MRHPLLPELIADAGRALYGEEWGIPLANALGLNPRTVQRIAQAAREGEGYRSINSGMLKDLAALLATRQAEIRRLEQKILGAAAVVPPAKPPGPPPAQ